MTLRLKRIPKELKMLQESPDGYEVSLVNDAIDHWVVTIPARHVEDTAYAGGKFKVDVTFSEEYPHVAPSMRFITPIFSPSVDAEGKLCERLLDGWQPSQTASSAFETLRTIFVDFTVGVVNTDAAKLAAENPKKFVEDVKKHTKKHAH